MPGTGIGVMAVAFLTLASLALRTGWYCIIGIGIVGIGIDGFVIGWHWPYWYDLGSNEEVVAKVVIPYETSLKKSKKHRARAFGGHESTERVARATRKKQFYRRVAKATRRIVAFLQAGEGRATDPTSHARDRFLTI